MYEACFRVSLKHALLWVEIFKKLKLKGLQMEMVLGDRGYLWVDRGRVRSMFQG